MAAGKVTGLYISPKAGGDMQRVDEVLAITGLGLQGDRYCTGEGSFNKGEGGKRQLTLINARFVNYTDHVHTHRRNIAISGIELMYGIGRPEHATIRIGDAVIRVLKYCDPCNRPNKLCGKSKSVKEEFFDRGGLIAEVIKSGLIKVANAVVPPPKGY